MIPMWQKDTHTLYDAVVKLIPKDLPVDDEQRELVQHAQRLIDLVRLDGSWGVHNPRYTQELLNDARAKLLQARGGAKPEAKLDVRKEPAS
jgi:hypothetical protein